MSGVTTHKGTTCNIDQPCVGFGGRPHQPGPDCPVTTETATTKAMCAWYNGALTPTDDGGAA